MLEKNRVLSSLRVKAGKQDTFEFEYRHAI